MTIKKLSLAIASAAIGISVNAQEQLPTSTITAQASDADKQVTLDNQRVSAGEGVQVITEQYIRAQQASTLADVFRKTTSVQVDEEGGQQGSLVLVRGFTGDQVSVRVEGAPKNFNQVRHGGASTIWMEPDMYTSVAAVPGVASNVYGNGSLGGVVLLETKDPEDVLVAGETFAGSTRTSAESNGESFRVSTDLAAQISQNWAVNSTFTLRDTDTYEDGDGNDALQGSTGTEDTNWLLKAVYTPSKSQRLELATIGMRKEYESRTTVGSGLFGDPRDNEQEEDTYYIQYQLNPADYPLLNLNARINQTEIQRFRQDVPTVDEPVPDPGQTWGVETTYAELENTSTFFQSDEITHQLHYGFDYTRDDVTTAYFNEADRQLGAERTQLGIYVSNTTSFGENMELVASFRYDDFDMDMDERSTTSETAFSPKLSFNWQPFEDTAANGLGFFAIAGGGYRAPSVTEVRGQEYVPGDLSTCSVGRRSISCWLPNPELQGETSVGLEGGVSYAKSGIFSPADQLDFKVGYFYNEVEDLINTTVLNDEAADGFTVSQWVNVDDAIVRGYEVSMNYTSAHWFAALTAQDTTGVYASTTEDFTKGQELPDISPASVNFSIGGYLFEGKSRVGMDVTHRGSREYILRGNDRIRRSYTIYDLFASYQATNNFAVRARIENALDKLYTKRSIVVDSDFPEIDTVSFQPGRNIKLELEYSF